MKKIFRLIKKKIISEIYDGFNKDDKYVEIFKNPSSNEVESSLKGDRGVRGLLYQNGDIYIWPAEIYHNQINGNILDLNQIHFYTDGKKYIRFHRDGEIIDIEDLINRVNISRNILENIIDSNSAKVNIYSKDLKHGEENYKGLDNFINRKLINRELDEN